MLWLPPLLLLLLLSPSLLSLLHPLLPRQPPALLLMRLPNRRVRRVAARLPPMPQLLSRATHQPPMQRRLRQSMLLRQPTAYRALTVANVRAARGRCANSAPYARR